LFTYINIQLVKLICQTVDDSFNFDRIVLIVKFFSILTKEVRLVIWDLSRNNRRK